MPGADGELSQHTKTQKNTQKHKNNTNIFFLRKPFGAFSHHVAGRFALGQRALKMRTPSAQGIKGLDNAFPTVFDRASRRVPFYAG
jgi:hypothetical protein